MGPPRGDKGRMPRSSKDPGRLRQELRAARGAKSVKPRGTYSVSLAFFHMLSCQREGLMRLPQVILAAAISLACAAAEAAASPLMPMPSGIFLHENSGIDTVRWRHRRPFFWSGRGASVGRGDTDGSSSSGAARSLNSAVPPTGSEIFRLDLPRRRGWVDPPPPR
jgi:hypothetical protein